VQLALERLGRIRIAAAEGAPATAADLRAQLAWLVPAGFLLVTPWERLKEFPRYLQAIEQRLDKHGRDAKRDAQLVAQVAPLEARYRERVKAERGAEAARREMSTAGCSRSSACRCSRSSSRRECRCRHAGSTTPGQRGKLLCRAHEGYHAQHA
jgi:hypothetical protein